MEEETGQMHVQRGAQQLQLTDQRLLLPDRGAGLSHERLLPNGSAMFALAEFLDSEDGQQAQDRYIAGRGGIGALPSREIMAARC